MTPDQLVKACLLEAPTYYRNRFTVLERVLTNSGCYWDDNGSLVANGFGWSPWSEEEVIEQAHKKLDKAIEDRRDSVCPNHLVEAMKEKADFVFMLENIDVWSTTFCYETDDYVVKNSTLNSWLRYFPTYGPLFNPPPADQIDPEWRQAIREWLLMEVLPTLRGNFHVLDPVGEEQESVARLSKAQQKIWHAMHKALEDFTTEEDRQREAEQARISSQIVDEILEELK